ncbi:glycosyltransferase [Geodermatophilus sp. SYSU D01045]
MRLLVHPHLMEIGGSQLTAVELAARAQADGHEVLVFAPDGVLVDRVRELGLEYHRAPVENSWPSVRTMNELCRLVRDRRIDLVHGYEWGPALDLAYGPHLRLGVPMVVTVLSMYVSRVLPRHFPLVVGTRELADEARTRHREVHLIEPPIDTDLNAPGPDRAGARRRFGVADDEVLLAVVCRMSADLDKAAGVLEAITAVGRLSRRRRVRLLVVGEGPAAGDVESRAAEVNAAAADAGADRPPVVVAGGLVDPRPAYDAADVVLGMGSSAMKGMAFGKPLVVQGSNGYWRLLTPETVPEFLEQGWYGHGQGDGAALLERVLDDLLDDPAQLVPLGALGRRLVTDRFSLTAAAARQEEVYRGALARRLTRAEVARRLARPAVRLAKFQAVEASPRLQGWADRREAVRVAAGAGR